MEATRGQREMYARYEGNPQSGESMHDAGPTGQSHLKEAKAAAEARGEHIFAKADHLGIQARPAVMRHTYRCPMISSGRLVLQHLSSSDVGLAGWNIQG
jgi:hypothetical protein